MFVRSLSGSLYLRDEGDLRGGIVDGEVGGSTYISVGSVVAAGADAPSVDWRVENGSLGLSEAEIGCADGRPVWTPARGNFLSGPQGS